MELNLQKPIVFFDLETTGIDIVNDRIIEFSFIKIHTDQSEETWTQRVNPGMPIPPKSTEIHGIKDEDVADKPLFKDVAKKVAAFIEGCDLGGFNSNKFDIPMLAEELARADVDIDLKKVRHIDVQTIFHKMEQRTLEAAYKFYCQKDLTEAHTAEADTRATYEVLKAQLDRYKDVDFKDKAGKISQPVINDIDQLAEFSTQNRNVDFAGRVVYNNDGEEVFNFGKYKYTPVEEVFEKDPGYYSWILNSDFPSYTKRVLTAIKLRKMMQ
ncbi:DNA polymerase III PolC-type [Salinivirga cyanobacteriivorans]|uniref:DNA polymerase III PolC-type n=1 Tax=Salinivirga cyanobacteriivorans TaxID=1307839 RepID=A0A0S2I451_9BACT|nr:3'-5' exonuclease [Salinivirga cyanobacteriivorans]ALO17002.1 DNA polymerase III PolC-type [Salinivirga cyanobacteriivorans]